MYRTECTMFDEVYMGNPGKVPYCNERDQFEPDCTNCERPNVTQADKIRSMTDEELADLLVSTDGDFPPNCEDVPVRKLEAYWLDWLRREAQ